MFGIPWSLGLSNTFSSSFLKLWGETRTWIPDSILSVLLKPHLPGPSVLLQGQPLHKARLHSTHWRQSAPPSGIMARSWRHGVRLPAESSFTGEPQPASGQRAPGETGDVLRADGAPGARAQLWVVGRGLSGWSWLHTRLRLQHAGAAAATYGEALSAERTWETSRGVVCGGCSHRAHSEAKPQAHGLPAPPAECQGQCFTSAFSAFIGGLN